MASVYVELREAIVAILSQVPQIGIVHNRVRYTSNDTEYYELFKFETAGRTEIRGWTITRERLEVEADAFKSEAKTSGFVIRGYLGFIDTEDTDAIFQELLDEVLDTLNNRKDLGESVVIDYGVGKAFCRRAEVRNVGAFLCHYCEIELPIEVRRAVTYA